MWRTAALVLSVSLLSGGTAVGQAPGAIKIGILAEQTGFFAFGGQDSVMAATLYVDQLNAKGGINGRRVELVVQDTASDPERGVVAARKLIEQDKVVAIAGLGLVSVALAVVPLVAQRGPVTFSVSGAYLPQPNHAMVFGFNPSVPDLMRGSMLWLKKQGKTRVALLSTNDATGQSAEKGFQFLTKLNGLTSTGIEFFNPAAPSAVAELSKLKGANPEAILAWTVGRATGVVAAAVQQLGLTQPIVTTEGNLSGAFLKQVGGMGADFFAMAVTKDTVDVRHLNPKDPQTPLIAAYRKAFISRHKVEPGPPAGGTWDALSVLTEAIRKVGTDSAAITRHIEGMKGFVGIQGIYEFSPQKHRGIGAESLVNVRIVKGQLVPAD